MTENYSYSDFLRDSLPETVPILIVKADGSLRFHSPEAGIEPEAGDMHYDPASPESQPAMIAEAVAAK